MNDNLRLIEVITRSSLDQAFRYTAEDYAKGSQEAVRWFNWDWYIGVVFYGIWKANELLRDEGNVLQMKDWIDARIDNGIAKLCVNTGSPMTTVLRLEQLYPGNKYEGLCRKFDDYYFNKITRISNGALTHTRLKIDHPDLIWADTLFMSVIYLAQRGVMLNDQRFLDDAGRQLYLHMSCLADPDDGLFYHGWDDTHKKRIGVKWGRGNGWTTVSAVEILEAIGEDFPERQAILDHLDRQLASLEKLQDESGRWRTVLDAPETYLETSVTAGVAFGVLKGIRLGLVDSRYRNMAKKAIKALQGLVDPEGNVLGGSAGTPVMDTAADYNNIPYLATPFTQGLTLMALSEAERNRD